MTSSAWTPGLKSALQGKGMAFIEVDKPAFRDALRQTSFYTDWKGKFGDQAWAALQSVSGNLT